MWITELEEDLKWMIICFWHVRLYHSHSALSNKWPIKGRIKVIMMRRMNTIVISSLRTRIDEVTLGDRI